MCHDWKSDPQPLGVRDDAPSNRATRPGATTLPCERSGSWAPQLQNESAPVPTSWSLWAVITLRCTKPLWHTLHRWKTFPTTLHYEVECDDLNSGVLPAEGKETSLTRGERSQRDRPLTRLHGFLRVRVRALHVFSTCLCALLSFLLSLLTCENLKRERCGLMVKEVTTQTHCMLGYIWTYTGVLSKCTKHRHRSPLLWGHTFQILYTVCYVSPQIHAFPLTGSTWRLLLGTSELPHHHSGVLGPLVK